MTDMSSPPPDDIAFMAILDGARRRGFQPVEVGRPVQNKLCLWWQLRMFFRLERLIEKRREMRRDYL